MLCSSVGGKGGTFIRLSCLSGMHGCSARRVQNMGWTPTNTLWLATRGGDVYFGSQKGAVGTFEQAKLGSRGFGILDVGYARPALLLSSCQGKTCCNNNIWMC